MDRLQAVILAGGRGSRMTPLLGSSIVKCLLPVCGHPIIFYPLQLLAINGYAKHGVSIIVQENHRDEIKRVVEKICEKLKIHVDLFSISEDSEEFGPCESIRGFLAAKKVIQENLLIVSCDTITSASLSTFVNFHITRDSDCTALFVKPIPALAGRLPGPKSSSKPEKDLLGLNPETAELLFLASEADFEDEVYFPLSALRHCSNIRLITNLMDSHIYLIHRKLLEDHLFSNKSFVSLKGEFLPHVAGEEEASRVYAFVDSGNTGVRVNNTYSYALANKSAEWIRRTFSLQRPEKDVTSKTTAKIQGSVIGENCELGEKSKIVNSLVLGSVEIGEGAVLENCIVSIGSKIGAKAQLKECLVGPKYIVAEGGRYTNESLTVAETTFFEP